MDAGRVLCNQNNEIYELPSGYKFHPTSFEVLQYYLVPKLKDEFKYAREDEAYLFVPVTRKLLQEEGDLTRVTPNGCWRSYEKKIPIYARDGSTIGYRNKLEYYNGNDLTNGVKTDWKMVEYRSNFRVNGNLESCMVCKVNLKVKVEEIPDEEDEAMSADESGESENINVS
ncbi:NAC domain-containing protein 7 [Phtheirospermum japonicum]|uniref:NAC domain-containing protein 7 n=1 Tax=Phtheirospermum japonicum TaxID=374723 RepID=A0A830DEA1_9LAMI|nr:NAC domain-containing protein 7 [Phtheirospermum japonicum]